MAKVTGEGTIVQLEKDKPKSKCRKWQLRVPVGLDPRTGKYKTRTRRVSDMNYTQAKKALRDFIEEIEDDKVWKRTGTTFEECAADFMDRREQSGEFTQNTNKRYRVQFKAISRHIGKADVASITPEMIEDMYLAMRQGDTLSGKPSSGAYLNRLHKMLNLLFKHLVNEEVIVRNPLDRVATPANDTKERRALTSARMRSLIDQLEVETSCDIAYFLAITMGLRRGEICALSWRDVDFDNRVLTVSHSFDCFRNLKETKTRAGTRRLPIPEFVCEALLRRKVAQREYFKTRNYVNRHHRTGYVEQDEDTPVVLDFYAQRTNPDTLGKWWKRDRAAFGLDGWCLHELRHSYLSMLAEQGVHPKVMQELAGHANSQITMDIYTHVNMDQKREAADVVEDAFMSVGAEEEFMARQAEKAPAGKICKVRHSRPSRRSYEVLRGAVQTGERFVPDSYQQQESPRLQLVDGTSDLQVSEAI